MHRNVHNIILVELHFITQSVFNKILFNKLETAASLFFIVKCKNYVTGHHVAINFDKKIKSCSVDDRFIFLESDNIQVHDDPANNITTMCSMLGKEGIICVPSNVSSFARVFG